MNLSRNQRLQLMWGKAKRLLEFLAYGLFDTLMLGSALCKPRSNSRLAAIVHLELLGDYVLWLPYGRALVSHLHKQGWQVVLVLNLAVATLAKNHFPECKVVTVDRRRFVKNWHVRHRFLRNLRKLCVDVTYIARHPRDTLVDDAVVRALGAGAWGFDSTFADRPWIDQLLNRRLYTRLLPVMVGLHQTLRHRVFVQAVGVPAESLVPPVDFPNGLKAPVDGPYLVIAPGASQGKRRWPMHQFVAVVRQILDHHQGWRCLVVGTAAEREIGEQIAASLGEQADNRAGCTDVLGLVGCIAHARLVLGNDSAAVHIAAACGVPGVAVVGGGHFGRCFPYDSREALVLRLPATVARTMDCFGCDWICRYRVAAGKPYPCIEAVTVEAVWEGVKTALAEGCGSPGSG